MARQPGPGCGAAWRSHVDAGATGAMTCPLLDFRNQGRGGSETRLRGDRSASFEFGFEHVEGEFEKPQPGCDPMNDQSTGYEKPDVIVLTLALLGG